MDLLIQQLKYPLRNIKYKLTEQGLKTLRANSVPDDLINKLEALRDQEYPNRDEFLRKLRETAGSISSIKVMRFILICASEEEEFED